MNFLVINGSPKGKYSVTLQTVNYLQTLHAEHTFEVINAAAQIKLLEKDFSAVLEAIGRADVLLFSYPVYTFIAPSQLHRFIELMKESGASFEGKFASQITTSKHFYDVTAHRYIQDNCQDMGMKCIRGLSADMDDLLTEKGQKEADSFLKYVTWSVQNDQYEPFPEKQMPSVRRAAEIPFYDESAKRAGDVVIVTDLAEDDEQLKSMIERFRAVFPKKTRLVNLREFPFKGGCLGCFNCAVLGKCVYKDGFDEFLRGSIQSAQAVVYAFTIRDHSMGSLFKMYDDRNFCNGHRTVTMGSPVGYIVSGDYSKEMNLQTVIEGRAQVGSNFLAGIASDEQDTDRSIDDLAKKLSYALDNQYVPPQNFYGIGGMKIFRDLIWLMQGMMKADHKFYKAHGQYDFPQKKWTTMLKMYLVGALISSPKIKEKMGNAMNEGMLMPYKKLLEKVQKQLSEKAGK